MKNTVIGYLRLAKAYLKLNWRMQMEYRGAFISQLLAMFLNNSTWLAFWLLFFSRFPVVRGWSAPDVITLWAVCAAGFGLANAIFWNLHGLASMVAKGQLDVWLLYPRALLPHLALGKMSATALGDLSFLCGLPDPGKARLGPSAALQLSCFCSSAAFCRFQYLEGLARLYLRTGGNTVGAVVLFDDHFLYVS